jgi:hypothetical protein
MTSRIVALSLFAVALLEISTAPAAAWWQFVAWSPSGERKVYTRYPTEQACQQALKKIDAELAKKYPKLYPRVGSCEEYR